HAARPRQCPPPRTVARRRPRRPAPPARTRLLGRRHRPPRRHHRLARRRHLPRPASDRPQLVSATLPRAARAKRTVALLRARDHRHARARSPRRRHPRRTHRPRRLLARSLSRPRIRRAQSAPPRLRRRAQRRVDRSHRHDPRLRRPATHAHSRRLRRPRHAYPDRTRRAQRRRAGHAQRRRHQTSFPRLRPHRLPRRDRLAQKPRPPLARRRLTATLSSLRPPNIRSINHTMKVLYTTQATSTGGRAGSSQSDDGALAVTLTTPKELGGDGAPGTNPEQLFAAGYSACFLGALKFVAGKAGVKIPAETTVSAKIGIGPRDDGAGFGIEAALTITVPGVERS